MLVKISNGRLEKRVECRDGLYTLKPKRKTRSDAQNRLIHGLLFPESAKAISEKTGRKITPEFAKSLLKTKFAIEHDEELGEYMLLTSKMSTERLSRFIEDCVRYISAYCDYYIQLPDDRDWET